MLRLAAPEKVAFHREKLAAVLAGKPVFPVMVEMDLTTHCARRCPDCPSTTSPRAKEFALADIDDFFQRLERQTHGLLLSGGEPTSSPDFPAFMALARRRGFREIAIVTNGAHLGEERVAAALLKHGTVVRISLYDWEQELSGAGTVLRRIGRLRERIERTGSSLHLGVSALTNRERAGCLPAVVDAVRSAGAHWIYFHPLCLGWGSGALEQADQAGVVQQILLLQKRRDDFAVSYCAERYESRPLRYSEYCAAHLLMVVGADGVNYLGTEVKYLDDYALTDVTRDRGRGFLWRAERLERIKRYNHRNYPSQGGRHRGLLYNHFVERLRQGREEFPVAVSDFLYPHIL